MTEAVKTLITVRATVNAPAETVWKHWTSPESIKGWNYASDDWHSPRAENDLRKGGRFNVRMEARDGSMGFDFGGVYDNIVPDKEIDYTMDDNRKVRITFASDGRKTDVIETFEAESTNTIDQQRNGWQSILDNFKKFVESHK